MSHPTAVYRRRRLTALAVLAIAVAAVALVVTLLSGSDAAERPTAKGADAEQATPTPEP